MKFLMTPVRKPNGASPWFSTTYRAMESPVWDGVWFSIRASQYYTVCEMQLLELREVVR